MEIKASREVFYQLHFGYSYLQKKELAEWLAVSSNLKKLKTIVDEIAEYQKEAVDKGHASIEDNLIVFSNDDTKNQIDEFAKEEITVDLKPLPYETLKDVKLSGAYLELLMDKGLISGAE